MAITVLLTLSSVLAMPSQSQETGNGLESEKSSDVEKKKVDEIRNSEKRTEGFLTPQDSLKALELPDGFHAKLFAAEPEVRQPIAATTDSRGRLWVCENYTYSESKVNFDLSLSDRIIILHDADQDGKAESRKIFWDKAKRLTGIAIGFDGVFVACAPNLLFIPDRNHDDVPDGPPEILLNGWNDDAVRHNIVNGLMWGPDGWLYGRHGIMGTSFVGKPGDTSSQRIPINCGIWRYHPLHRKFEVVAHGTTNPWGMDFNNEGDLFMINTVIGHLWHVVPGARYERMYGSHFNPYTYQSIQQTADHFHWNKTGGEAWHDTKKTGVTDATDKLGGGHAHCGLLLYCDDHWPAKYKNTILTCNLHGLRLNNDRIEPHGNGFIGKHNPDFARTTDTWFRGIELVRSHDQGFYLLDWQDTGECHENDGVHRTSGRIYKVTYGDSQLACTDFSGLKLAKLKEMLDEDRWHSQQAIMEIRTRLASGKLKVDAIRDLVSFENETPGRVFLTKSLASDYGFNPVYGESLRQLQLQMKLEKDEEPSGQAFKREVLASLANEVALSGLEKVTSPGQRMNTAMAQNKLYSFALSLVEKSSPRTRLEIASVLPRLQANQCLGLAKHLLQFGDDRDDKIQPLLIYYALEPHVEKSPERVAKLAMESEIPLVTELLARRISERIGDEPFTGQVVNMVSNSESNVKLTWILSGIAKALKGRKKVTQPEKWKLALSDIKLGEKQAALVKEIQIVFGDGQTLEQVRKIAANKNADPRMRGQAILTLAENGAAKLVEFLDRNFGDKDVRQYVIEAYAFCNDPGIAKRIINQFQKLKPAGKLAAINTLTKRSTWAESLLTAIQSGKIEKKYLTAWHARQIVNLGDAGTTEKLVEVWGAIRKTPAAKQKELDMLKSMMTSTKPQPDSLIKGRRVFEKSCANCHVLFGVGGKIGPDLTGSNRKDLGYLLENIIDPSSSVADTFRSSIIALEDGRTITGVILSETKTTMRVQTSDKLVVVDRNEIENIKKTDQSLMPEGLLNDLSPRQKTDLLFYLMSN